MGNFALYGPPTTTPSATARKKTLVRARPGQASPRRLHISRRGAPLSLLLALWYALEAGDLIVSSPTKCKPCRDTEVVSCHAQSFVVGIESLIIIENPGRDTVF